MHGVVFTASDPLVLFFGIVLTADGTVGIEEETDTATLGGALSGMNTMTKTDHGTLVLSGNSSAFGGTFVQTSVTGSNAWNTSNTNWTPGKFATYFIDPRIKFDPFADVDRRGSAASLGFASLRTGAAPFKICSQVSKTNDTVFFEDTLATPGVVVDARAVQKLIY